MEKIFYLYGFVYIIMYMHGIYSAITFNLKKRKDEMLSNIPDINMGNMTKENLEKSKEVFINEVKNKIPSILLSLITTVIEWSWIIIGFLYMEETKLFSALLFITIFSLAWTLIYSVYSVIKNKNTLLNEGSPSIKENFDSVWSAIPNTTIILVVERIARIAIAGYILYIYFFI